MVQLLLSILEEKELQQKIALIYVHNPQKASQGEETQNLILYHHQ
jgi:hypothetical protein